MCSKSERYHKWHHYKHHKKVHFGALVVSLLVIVSLMISSLVVPIERAKAATKDWDLSSSGDYTVSDSNKIEVTGGVVQLKAQMVPGTDWINTFSGSNWNYRRAVTIYRAGTTLSNQVIKITEATTGMADVFTKAKTNGGDIRFTQQDGSTPITGYWIKNYTTTPSNLATIYVNIPSILGGGNYTTVYLYYGNASVSTTGSGVVTFNYDFADSFSDFDFSYDYSGEPNTPVISSGTVILDSANDYFWGGMGVTPGGKEVVWEFKAKVTGDDTLQLGVFGDYVGVPLSQLECSSPEDCVAMALVGGTGGSINGMSAFVEGEGFALEALSGSPEENVYHDYKIVLLSGAYIKFYDNEVLLGTIVYSEDPAPNMPIGYVELSPMVNGTGIIDRIFSYEAEETLVIAIGSEVGRYPTDNPWVMNSTAQSYSLASDFVITPDDSTNIKFQISPDNGVTWYWYNNGWTATTGGYTEANIYTDIDSHIGTFYNGTNTRSFKWKAYLHSDSVTQTQLSSVTLTYTMDTVAPDNPTSVTAKDSVGGAQTLTTNNWYNDTAPYFTWDEPSDNANTGGGEVVSGVAGYNVYFGTEIGGNPIAYQVTRNYTGSGMVSGSTYYLRMETVDVAGNVSLATELFRYKYDGDAPINPIYVTVSPSSFTATNEFIFTWPAGSDALSQWDHYEYRVRKATGTLTDWTETTNLTETLTDLAEEGTNVFYLATVDIADNHSNPIQTNFLYAGTSPSAPTGLEVSPSNTSEGSPASENSFSFHWHEPDTHIAEITQYRYAINSIPTSINTTVVASGGGTTTLASGAFATQQGLNTFYVVAEDSAEQINYGNYASVPFYVSTSAPGIPTALQIFDISNRDSQEYATSLKWSAPVNQGTGFAGYEIYRSLDNTTYSSIGTTAGTTYADTGIQSQKYYYYVKSKDNSNNYSEASSVVDITPTGKYTQAPSLVLDTLHSDAHALASTITWSTRDSNDAEHTSSGYVLFGSDRDNLSGNRDGTFPAELNYSNVHSIRITGLSPKTKYYYQAVWRDRDGNEARSGVSEFTTTDVSTVSDVLVSNITLYSATIAFKSTLDNNPINATVNIRYGTSTSYGSSLPSSSAGNSHTFALSGLDDTTTYHFQVFGTDENGDSILSDDYSFATLTMPKIDGNVTMDQDIEAPTTTYRFSWKTNVKTSSVVNYTNDKGKKESKTIPDLTLDHNVTVSNLADQSIYTFEVGGNDENWINVENPYTSQITTPKDSRAPKVTKLTVEVKSSGFGVTQKAQLVVTWETDEPSSSQVEYDLGISGGSYANKSKEDAALSTSHAVILAELEPSKIYHLRAVSKDASGNIGYSEDTTTITGKMQNSVLDIIINSLEKSLGWLFGIFK